VPPVLLLLFFLDIVAGSKAAAGITVGGTGSVAAREVATGAAAVDGVIDEEAGSAPGCNCAK